MPKSRAAVATGRPAVRTAWTKAVRSSDTVLVPQGMIDPLSAVDHARKRHPCPCTTCHPCPCAMHLPHQGGGSSGGVGTVRYPRTVANSGDSAAKLKARTLTNLYDESPAWLTAAHAKLDAAV